MLNAGANLDRVSLDPTLKSDTTSELTLSSILSVTFFMPIGGLNTSYMVLITFQVYA